MPVVFHMRNQRAFLFDVNISNRTKRHTTMPLLLLQSNRFDMAELGTILGAEGAFDDKEYKLQGRDTIPCLICYVDMVSFHQ